jgi:hypothetical protein
MCIPYEQSGPKARRLRFIANVALVLGLTPWIFREYLPINPLWLHAFCGFFIGISIPANLFACRLVRQRTERKA